MVLKLKRCVSLAVTHNHLVIYPANQSIVVQQLVLIFPVFRE